MHCWRLKVSSSMALMETSHKVRDDESWKGIGQLGSLAVEKNHGKPASGISVQQA